MIETHVIKRDFPSLAGKVYLNTAAEGILPKAVDNALRQYVADKLQGMDGRDAHLRVEGEAREIAARHLGLKAEEIGFCSCSAEAYNLLSGALALQSGDEVVLSDLDFPSGVTPWLTARDRPTIRLWRADKGCLNLDDLAPLLGGKTKLVQVSLVSFYNGFRLVWAPFLEMVRRRAPQAVVAVDITQALGRFPLDCTGADVIISSTHKWMLGIHGGGIVGIPTHAAERLRTCAGGWYHLKNPFGPHRFERAEVKPGAAGFGTGMPSYAAIYALNAGLRYLDQIGVGNIAQYADPLVERVHQGIAELGLLPLAPYEPHMTSGIIAFSHAESDKIHTALRAAGIHVMNSDGRLRISIHGYNTARDVECLLANLAATLKTVT